MYGIPNNVDWSFLISKELLQVCIGRHQISLRFEGDVSIDIECAFDHFGPSSKLLSVQLNCPERAATLVSLLGMMISTATNKSGTTLELVFSNLEVLAIHD